MTSKVCLTLSLPWLTVSLEVDNIQPSLANVVTALANGVVVRVGQARLFQGSPTEARQGVCWLPKLIDKHCLNFERHYLGS
jgi:hypothetical protein